MSTTELVVIDEESLPSVFTVNGSNEIINDIKKKVTEFVSDVSTSKGRDEIRSNAYKIAQSKQVIDKHRKNVKADLAEQVKLIDQSGKKIRDELDALRDEVRLPLTEWEEIEEKRIATEKLEKEIAICFDMAIEDNKLFDRQKELELKEAQLAKEIEDKRIADELEQNEKDRIDNEEKLKADAIAEEKKRADDLIEKERKESAKREADALVEKEKAEREAEESEKRRIADAEKAEKDKAEAIEEAEREAQAKADKKESDRLAAEILAKRIADEKSADVEHRREINKEAFYDLLQLGLSDEATKSLIIAIAKGKVRNITINY